MFSLSNKVEIRLTDRWKKLFSYDHSVQTTESHFRGGVE